MKTEFFISCGHESQRITDLEARFPNTSVGVMGDTVVVRVCPKNENQVSDIEGFIGQDSLQKTRVIADGYSAQVVLAL